MINECIEFVMDDIGCPKHLKGYECLYRIIKHMIEHPEEGLCESYVTVAEELNTRGSRIERNIRHLIAWILNNCDYNKIYNYFGNSAPTNGGITNKQFVLTLAVAAKRMYRVEDKNA